MPGKRKPTKLKLLKGTLRNDRINPKEPQPAQLVASPPEHMSEAGKRAWQNFAALLNGMRILTEADAVALEDMSETYADLIIARKALRERGSATYQSGPIWRPYPEIARIADSSRRLLTLLSRFGLTPADRARVSAMSEQVEDPWAVL